jgi:hypothetical protein
MILKYLFQNYLYLLIHLLNKHDELQYYLQYLMEINKFKCSKHNLLN